MNNYYIKRNAHYLKARKAYKGKSWFTQKIHHNLYDFCTFRASYYAKIFLTAIKTPYWQRHGFLVFNR